MNSSYYEMMDRMEKAGVNVQYMDGWACGYLHNPRRGEQYLTEAYEAGYQDGLADEREGFQAWVPALNAHCG